MHCQADSNDSTITSSVSALYAGDQRTKAKLNFPHSNQGCIQDLKLGGREMWSGRSSAEGTRMEAPKAPTRVGSGEGAANLA